MKSKIQMSFYSVNNKRKVTYVYIWAYICAKNFVRILFFSIVMDPRLREEHLEELIDIADKKVNDYTATIVNSVGDKVSTNRIIQGIFRDSVCNSIVI